MATPDKPRNAVKFDIAGARKEEASVPQQLKSTDPTLRKFHWFSSSKGRRVVGGAIAVASIGASVYKVLPHTFGLRSYVKGVYQHYSNGFVTNVNENMKALVKEVTNEMELSDAEKKQLSVFVSSHGAEPYGWGGMSRDGDGYGVLVGYPYYFHWNQPKDVPIERMRFGPRHATGANSGLSKDQITSPEAMVFRRSMILSENEKKFALAREIERTRSNSYAFQSLLPGCWLFITFLLSRAINNKLGLFRAPFSPIHRLVAYVVVGNTMGLSYCFIKDGAERYAEGGADRRAASVSADYARGGVGFYNKLMERNVSLRSLEQGGEDKYNMIGDFVQGIIRVKWKPLSERKQICQTRLDQLQ